jgi:hypothetical protein
VAEDGGGQPARHGRAVEHAPVGTDADQRHPRQPAQGRGPVRACREAGRAVRPARRAERQAR